MLIKNVGLIALKVNKDLKMFYLDWPTKNLRVISGGNMFRNEKII